MFSDESILNNIQPKDKIILFTISHHALQNNKTVFTIWSTKDSIDQLTIYINDIIVNWMKLLLYVQASFLADNIIIRGHVLKLKKLTYNIFVRHI